jgi:hypothetical protein
MLAQHFLGTNDFRQNFGDKTLTAEAKTILTTYGWPGNVRELENAIQHAGALADSNEIDVADLPEKVRGSAARRTPLVPTAPANPPHHDGEWVKELIRANERMSELCRERNVPPKAIENLLGVASDPSATALGAAGYSVLLCERLKPLFVVALGKWFQRRTKRTKGIPNLVSENGAGRACIYWTHFEEGGGDDAKLADFVHHALSESQKHRGVELPEGINKKDQKSAIVKKLVPQASQVTKLPSWQSAMLVTYFALRFAEQGDKAWLDQVLSD